MTAGGRQAGAEDASIVASAAALLKAGDFRAALDLAGQGLASRPHQGDLLILAGVAARMLGQTTDAERFWSAAIDLPPVSFAAHLNLATLFNETGRLAEAEAAYRHAIGVDPVRADARLFLGNLLRRLGRLDEAAATYRQAIALEPGNLSALFELAALQQIRGQLAEAEDLYRRIIAARPDFAPAHHNLGGLLLARHCPREAETAYRKAIDLNPGDADTWFSLGVLLQDGDRHGEAADCYRHATALKPDHVEAIANTGAVAQTLGRFDEAATAYRHALAARPDDPDIRWNLSLLLLSLGRFSEAWPLHESRHDPRRLRGEITLPHLSFPQWRGESLTGKSLLIWPEQGLGDEIQFCRYVPLLKALGASRVDLVCKPPLAPLLSSLAGVDGVLPEPVTPSAGEYDFWALPLSLPCHLGTTPEGIPARLPYLFAQADAIDRWRPRFSPGVPPGATPEVRVGLAWKGSPGHRYDGKRSLPSLGVLAPLWSVPGLVFVSLQKGTGEDEAASPPASQPLLHLGGKIRDFADTAAIIDQLDLVICVDTAVAHLAGALGKPCWVLLPAVGLDWRWMHEREDSPWYPGVMRLFRQGHGEGWDAVLARVATALAQWRAGIRGKARIP